MQFIKNTTKIAHQVREGYTYRWFLFNQNHIWIASFPRSGNTWVRSMIHQALFGGGNDNILNEIRKSIPDIHNSWDILNVKTAKTIYIKTHFSYQKYCRKVIYIIRNPLDVLYSYWLFDKQINKSKISLDDFIEQELSHGSIYGKWDNHVLSYLNAGLGEKKLLLLRYEEIIKDPFKTLNDIFDFTNIYHCDSDILMKVSQKTQDILLQKHQLSLSDYEEKAKAICKIQNGKGIKKLNDKQIQKLWNSSIGITAKSLNYSIS